MTQLNLLEEKQEIRAIYITKEQRDLFAQLAQQHEKKIHGKLLQILVDAWDEAEVV